MSLNFEVANGSFLLVHISIQEPIISDSVRRWLDTVLNFLIFVFGSLGMVTNAINMRVFVQQGLSSDSSTIGLFALAIADFLGCILLVPNFMCDIMKYTAPPAMAFSCASWFALMCPIPHLAMSRLTCWITVYIAVERSLCVLIPFKVKLLIQPKVTATAMTMLYVIGFGVYFPLYVNTSVEVVFLSRFNSTAAAYKETALGNIIRNYFSLVFNTIMSTVAVIIVAIATGLMLYKLRQLQKWRKKSATAGKAAAKDAVAFKQDESRHGKKDVEVLKTVLMVTGLFLVCLSMSHFPGFASAIVPGFSFTGLNKNIFYILYLYKFVFDLVNSSLNFFFYIRISSRYKAAFNEVFRKRRLKRELL